MQNFDSPNIHLDHLLFELSRCINDLQGLYPQLSIEDRKQLELNLRKLELLGDIPF